MRKYRYYCEEKEWKMALLLQEDTGAPEEFSGVGS